MTDRLAKGSTNRMRGARDPHVHGRMFHGRGLELLTAREQHRLLPDFECEHGRLSCDPTPDCGCFPRDTLAGELWKQAREHVPATRNQSTRRFDHEEAVRMYLCGWTGAAIARRFGVHKESVYAVLRKTRRGRQLGVTV